MLNATEAPLFFLWTQLMVAVLLFLLSNLFRLLPDKLTLDLAVCKSLTPLVLLNVASLRFIFLYILCSPLLTGVLQLQQLYLEICRRLLLPGCAWPLTTLHRRNILYLATLSSLFPHPLSLFTGNRRLRRRSLPRWHTHIFDRRRLWRCQLSHRLSPLRSNQEESQHCKWQRSLPVMVQ